MPSHDFALSLEFFPPKSLDASFNLWNSIQTLSPLNPEFVSVTYGAGGTTRDLTVTAVDVINRRYQLPVAGHLTCVDATKGETLAVARAYAAKGVKRIVALRGDAPKNARQFTPHPNGFSGSLDLITALKKLNAFEITVAAHPHPHPDAANAKADIDMLKAKFDAGADNAITQFFFDPEDFLRFRDRCLAAGISQKIIPGILPSENWSKTRAFAAGCGLPIPEWLDQGYHHAAQSGTNRLFSTAICSELCDTLLCEGVSDLHFYTLNDPNLTLDVCRALGRTLRQPALEVTARA